METDLPDAEIEASAAEERDEKANLKCAWCGCYPNRTHRGGRIVAERFYCKPHAAFVEAARRAGAIMWGSRTGERCAA